jgi:PEGA domain
LPLRVVTLQIAHPGYKSDERRVALTTKNPTITVDARLAAQEPIPQGATATTGVVVVESRPSGAQVTMDGTPVGATPLTLPEVAPGTHRITLQMSGFSPWVTTAQVTAGARTRVAASLEQGPQQ